MRAIFGNFHALSVFIPLVRTNQLHNAIVLNASIQQIVCVFVFHILFTKLECKVAQVNEIELDRCNRVFNVPTGLIYLNVKSCLLVDIIDRSRFLLAFFNQLF